MNKQVTTVTAAKNMPRHLPITCKRQFLFQEVVLANLSMACANIAGNQLGARIAIRYKGRGVRPLLVFMSIALTAKLLSDPANPLRLFVGGMLP